MLSRRLLVLSSAAVLAIAGCSSTATASPTNSAPAEATTSQSAAGPVVKFTFEGDGQAEVTSPGGTRVIFDVYDASLLSSPATAADTMVLTHTHHIDMSFVNSFPGKVLNMKVTTTKVGDVAITGIAAMTTDQAVDEANPTDVLNVVETGGIRLGFFGELGLAALTPAQLTALGRVDVLASPIAFSHLDISAANKKGINVATQVGPKMFVPTYMDMDSARLASSQWAGCYSANSTLSLSQAAFPAKPAVVFMGVQASDLGTVLKVPACTI